MRDYHAAMATFDEGFLHGEKDIALEIPARTLRLLRQARQPKLRGRAQQPKFMNQAQGFD